jgi:hypothetical protein
MLIILNLRLASYYLFVIDIDFVVVGNGRQPVGVLAIKVKAIALIA